jgi:hypothetical protein
METKNTSTRILELYVYGLLSDTENEEVTTMANTHSEIKDEIIAIEKTISIVL